MISYQTNLLEFIATPDIFFDIPLFQRNYTWSQDQCDELWRDILRSAKTNKSHFAGIVLYSQKNHSKSLSIIDGQQRITTIMLLLSAFAEYLESKKLTINGIDANLINKTYLYESNSPKLIPSKIDQRAFKDALKGSYINKSTKFRSQINRDRFLDAMRQTGFDPSLFLKGLQSLTIVAAQLEANDNQQAIFESFNAKGVPLVTTDLVRNHLLVAETAKQQQYLYETYWEPMQGRFGDDPGSLKLNNAIRAWVTIRCRSAHAKDDSRVFFAFKCYCEDEYDGTKENLLAELLSFAVVWAENYRYHAVKKFRSMDWASIGRKTLVSNRKKTPVDHNSYDYYAKHFGVNADL